MDAKTGAVIGGLVIVVVGVVGWLSTQTEHEGRERAPSSTPQPSEDHRPASLPDSWEWTGRVGWPALDALNTACRQMQACRELPGAQRAECFASGISRCEPALEALQSAIATGPADVVQIFELNAEQTAMELCVYQQNLQAHRDHPELVNAVSAPVSSEEAIEEVADGAGGEALAAVSSAISACMNPPQQTRRGTASTDQTLRSHFGCCRNVAGAGCVPVCCTPERVAIMVREGTAPLPPDSACL
jgi:hypothetical protein